MKFGKLVTTFGCLALFALTGASPLAATIYDEGVSGDLSGAFGAPDSIGPLAVGGNEVIGQIGANGNTGATNGSDADYFTFTVGVGQSVDAINVLSFLFAPTDPGGSFFGYIADTSFAGQAGGDIAGFALFNAASGDILGALAGGPLGPGDYAFWLQETAATSVDYTVSFVVSAVPLPAPLILMLSALTGLFGWTRRQQSALPRA